jgi:hypothetical protein
MKVASTRRSSLVTCIAKLAKVRLELNLILYVRLIDRTPSLREYQNATYKNALMFVALRYFVHDCLASLIPVLGLS